jgi:hypothetical protein
MPKKMLAKSKPPATDSRLDNFRELITNEELYFRRCLKILDKKNNLVPFVLNEPQKILKKIIDKQYKRMKRIRVIVLKARQEGVSTYFQGKFYMKAATKKFQRAMVVSHELDSAEHIFGMSKLFLQESPAEMVPMTKRSNRREILFENPEFDPKKGNNPGLRSYLKVDTAKDVDAGASKTVNMLHLSEVARWRNATATLTSLLQAVPDTDDTIVAIESTAQGVGGEFYDMYWAAKRGESDYVAVFLPWFINPLYSARVINATGKLVYDDEELKLKAKFNLSDEQLQWRRNTIASKCKGDVNLFHQEYPSTDEEAFLTSGARKYELDDIARAERHVLPPMMVGELQESKEGRVEFESKARGKLKIWELPMPGRSYLISADVGEGISEEDFSVAKVWDHVKWEQVAMWRGRCHPEDFALILDHLGKFYNKCMIAPESNSIGLTTCVVLKNLGYPNIYYSRKKDEKTLERTRKIGFLTTARTRHIGLGLLGKALKEDEVIIRDEETIAELKTFVSKDGKIQAEDGCFDDCVMATVIFVSVATELPPVDFEKEKKAAPVMYRGGVR